MQSAVEFTYVVRRTAHDTVADSDKGSLGILPGCDIMALSVGGKALRWEKVSHGHDPAPTPRLGRWEML